MWDNFEIFLKKVKRFVVVNNDGDVCVRITIEPYDDQTTRATFYYFQKGKVD